MSAIRTLAVAATDNGPLALELAAEHQDARSASLLLNWGRFSPEVAVAEQKTGGLGTVGKSGVKIRSSMHRKILPLLLLIAGCGWAQSRSVSVKLSFDRSQGPLDIDRIALGQGGLSADTMWEQREAEVRALHPHLIRLFVQEYFDLQPAPGQYHFDTLDKSVDLILRTGAIPLLSINFKPKVLFPRVDQDVVKPELPTVGRSGLRPGATLRGTWGHGLVLGSG